MEAKTYVECYASIVLENGVLDISSRYRFTVPKAYDTLNSSSVALHYRSKRETKLTKIMLVEYN